MLQVLLWLWCSDKFEDCGDDVDGTVEFNEEVVMGYPFKKEMASNAAVGVEGINVG